MPEIVTCDRCDRALAFDDYGSIWIGIEHVLGADGENGSRVLYDERVCVGCLSEREKVGFYRVRLEMAMRP